MVNSEVIFIGVDAASARVAFVALRGREFFTMAFTKLGATGGEACNASMDATHSFLDQLPWPVTEPIQAYVEWPVLGRGGFRSTIVQAFTSGAIQGVLYGRGCTTQGANVSSWKKNVVGKGNATKEDVVQSLRLRWPSLYREVAGDQDLCDAACVAIYGRQVQES
jgi:hypothetical protein